MAVLVVRKAGLACPVQPFACLLAVVAAPAQPLIITIAGAVACSSTTPSYSDVLPEY